MKKVFISSPYRRDVKANTEKARAYSRSVYEEGYIPIAPHLLFPQFLDEDNERERADGIAMGLELLLCTMFSEELIKRLEEMEGC